MKKNFTNLIIEIGRDALGPRGAFKITSNNAHRFVNRVVVDL